MGGSGSKKSSDEPPPLSQAEHGFVEGDRIQTQWTVEEGGNDQWYPGTVAKVLKDGRCKLKYDDGDSWTGDARFMMKLTDGAAPTASIVVSVVPDGGTVLVAQTALVQATVVPVVSVATAVVVVDSS